MKALALLVLGLEAAFLVTRLGLEWLGANATDPLTRFAYRFSGLPGTLQNQGVGMHSFDFGALVWFGLFAALWYGVARNRALLPRVSPAPAKG